MEGRLNPPQTCANVVWKRPELFVLLHAEIIRHPQQRFGDHPRPSLPRAMMLLRLRQKMHQRSAPKIRQLKASCEPKLPKRLAVP